MALAVDITDGRGLSNEVHREFTVEKEQFSYHSKLLLTINIPFLTRHGAKYQYSNQNQIVKVFIYLAPCLFLPFYITPGWSWSKCRA